MRRLPKRFPTARNIYTRGPAIGEGGCGTVFRVTDVDGVDRALKILDPEKATSVKRKRFQNELEFCARHDHPHIVKVIDSGAFEKDQKLYTFHVMPLYVATLRTRVREGIPPERVFDYFAAILDGIRWAHGKGTVHRDLKPENVLCGDAIDNLVIADFGCARFVEDEMAVVVETRNDERLANFVYAAPEQLVPGGEITDRTDVYALGLVFHEMFTGEVPRGTSHKTVASVAPEYAFVDALVDSMRRQTPADRPSAEEVEQQLSASIEKRPSKRMPTSRTLSEGIRGKAGEQSGSAPKHSADVSEANAGAPARMAAPFAEIGESASNAIKQHIEGMRTTFRTLLEKRTDPRLLEAADDATEALRSWLSLNEDIVPTELVGLLNEGVNNARFCTNQFAQVEGKSDWYRHHYWESGTRAFSALWENPNCWRTGVMNALRELGTGIYQPIPITSDASRREAINESPPTSRDWAVRVSQQQPILGDPRDEFKLQERERHVARLVTMEDGRETIKRLDDLAETLHFADEICLGMLAEASFQPQGEKSIEARLTRQYESSEDRLRAVSEELADAIFEALKALRGATGYFAMAGGQEDQNYRTARERIQDFRRHREDFKRLSVGVRRRLRGV